MTAEDELAAAVLGTLLRENFAGVANYIESDGQVPVLAMPGLPTLPLEPDGFLTDLRIRLPLPSLTLDEVGKALQALADPADADGVQAFAQECRETLAAHHLRGQETPRIIKALGRRPAPAWRGHEGQLAYDTLAAAQPHPAYPTAAARPGFTDDDALAYAPEYQPAFPLNWAAIPRPALTRGGPSLPSWWPRPSDVGLPAALDSAHEVIPVHPLTARRVLSGALTEAGLPAAKLIAPATRLKVTPTLSTRTVAVTSQPGVHLKLPLPTSTLGRLNRRSIVPGTLPDGALVRAVVAEAAHASPLLDHLLLADESRYAHAGHPFLGYLMRQLPGSLDRCHLVPLAALLAPTPGRRDLVIGDLARQHGDGTVTGLFRDYLDVLFGVHVELFVRFGIALEAHQQNAALVLAQPDDPLRLLVKDFDGALINYERLTGAPIPVPEPGDFADPRLLTSSDDALADVFITITVHLCAGALAFGLARRNVAPQATLLALIRQSLTRALDRYPGHPAAALLRARVLDADRLPGKAMLTAGTLQTKARSGASDINKFYGTTGPNYLGRR
ncbi:MAG TPA: IucA/IucC family protein [Streptosporangiaceae bacterium]|nr:IucA/IucC family protein [Streptosporangiaceae bacterium]